MQVDTEEPMPQVAVYGWSDAPKLDSSDLLGLSSLMRHLWNTQGSFFLCCHLNTEGQVLFFSDHFNALERLTECSRMIFHSRTFDLGFSKSSEAVYFEFFGYKDFRLDLDSLTSIGLPHLQGITLCRPFETFQATFSWINTLEKVPVSFSLAFEGEGRRSNEEVPMLLRTMDPRVAAQVTELEFQYVSRMHGNTLGGLFAGILPKFTKLWRLLLPDVPNETIPIVLGIIAQENAACLKNSLRELYVHCEYNSYERDLRNDPITEQAATNFKRSFPHVAV